MAARITPSGISNTENNELERISITVEKSLLSRFDDLVLPAYGNRSEAVRDLMRRKVNDVAIADPDKPVIATLCLIYDHESRTLSEDLTRIGHEFHGLVISHLHVHLSHDKCFEVHLLRGAHKEARAFAARCEAMKGVEFVDISIAADD